MSISCDFCANYIYDEEDDEYYCDVNLDEDEFRRFCDIEDIIYEGHGK